MTCVANGLGVDYGLRKCDCMVQALRIYIGGVRVCCFFARLSGQAGNRPACTHQALVLTSYIYVDLAKKIALHVILYVTTQLHIVRRR